MLRILWKNSDTVILSADQCNDTVVVDIGEYDHKIENLLKDAICEKIGTYLITNLEKTTKTKNQNFQD